jgi:threonine dehydrogenase-like Zn-dependent dehydrogenase
MKGLFVVERDRVDILDLPEPEIGPYEALVQVEACGICNSTDWKVIEGEFVSGSYPILLGHESCGRVIAVGDAVRSFRVGDRVLRSRLEDKHVPYPGGRSCWGGFVERAIVVDVWAKQGVAYNAFPHDQQVVPAGWTPVEAVASITLKETLSCLRNSDVKRTQDERLSLAIVGTGPVAQTLAHFAVLSDIRPVVVYGRRARWAETFGQLGVDGYVAGAGTLSREQVPPEVQAILDGGGFDRAIEAVGARSALTRCLEVVRPDGRVNLYGIAPESEPYLPEEEGDPRVFRGKVAEAEVHEQLIEWVEQGRVHPADWISHRMPWTEYRRGFDMVANKEANKVVLTFDV